ncbi:MAG: DHHA1 domain-containing protein, partial [Ruminococcus flavefaciens]|nr:DHHA1 domain-containing protein [Ruminococcus flavefaciens]
QEQKDKARKARKTTNYMGAEETVYQQIDPAITSTFVGYDRLVHDSQISVLTTEEEVVSALTDGQNGTIIVEETPFYGTMGGQQADVGVITAGENTFEVKDTIHLQGGKIGHVGTVTGGMFRTGDTVTLQVAEENRQSTCKNHSATHLLQKALRQVLGSHVEQAGSYVDAERLRFDFSHFSAMTPEEIRQVEEIVNEQIAAALPVITEEMTLEEAKQTGAMALFGEKYGNKVRVVQMGDFSVELCGGTHVPDTGAIAFCKIISESGVAAGVRRIEALTGRGLMNYYAQIEQQLHRAAQAAKAEPSNLEKKIHSMQDEIKALHSENEKLKAKLANEAAGDIDSRIEEISGMKFLAMHVPDVDMNGLRNLGDQMKEKIGSGVVVLASDQGGKVTLLAMATDDAISQGAHAGNLIREIASCVGGGGGGRPNMAQAGGKNPDGIETALAKAKEVMLAQLG